MPEVNMTLPELPGATLFEDADMIGFTAEQMLALRAAAFRAGMERAAEIARDQDGRGDPYDAGHDLGVSDCVDAIERAIRTELEQK
jgi:hypothetical protein